MMGAFLSNLSIAFRFSFIIQLVILRDGDVSSLFGFGFATIFTLFITVIYLVTWSAAGCLVSLELHG